MPVYYPYELIKTRMQTTEGAYNNLFDAFVKTYLEQFPKKGQWKKMNMRQRLMKRISSLSAFYEAMPYYGGTYVAFFAIEFALYETALREIEHRCEGKSALSTLCDSILE